jgi:integrase
MKRYPLTDFAIRNFSTSRESREEFWDDRLPGFGVRVSPSGNKSFALLYRLAGRSRRATLGQYPEMSLADARRLARRTLNAAAAGQDLRDEIAAAQRTHKFDQVLDTYLSVHCAQHNRPSSLRETAGQLRGKFLPYWHSRHIGELTKADITSILDKLVLNGTPSAANHAFAAIRTFFNWCLQRGLIATSPVTGMRQPTKSVTRERVLTEHELKTVWQAAAKLGYPFGSVVQLLLLTGQRRGELAGMAWNQLDLDAASWLLPAALTKSNRSHLLPLSKTAVHIIKQVPRQSPIFVFPARTRPDLSLRGFTRLKDEFNAIVQIENWTLHDLRRTAATYLARLGVQPYVVERILNHTSGTFSGVTGIYNRHAYVEEMRTALETWSAFLTTLAPAAHQQRSGATPVVDNPCVALARE